MNLPLDKERRCYRIHFLMEDVKKLFWYYDQKLHTHKSGGVVIFDGLGVTEGL